MEISRLAEVMQEYGLYITSGNAPVNNFFYVGKWDEDFYMEDGEEREQTNGVFTDGSDLEKAVYAYLTKIGRTFKVMSEDEPVIIPKGYKVIDYDCIQKNDLVYYGGGDFAPVSDNMIGERIWGKFLIIRAD